MRFHAVGVALGALVAHLAIGAGIAPLASAATGDTVTFPSASPGQRLT